MADERARYFRELRRLRRGARRWTVLGGGLTGAAAVLTPYAGLGLPDAAWAGAAGSAVALAAWRWLDLRAHAARPAPPALDPAEAAARSRARLVAAVERLPAGQGCWPRCAGPGPGWPCAAPAWPSRGPGWTGPR